MRNSSRNIDSSGAENISSEKSSDSLAEASRGEVSENIRRTFDRVPDIGTRWRWYDVPYRFFSWWLRSWRRCILPPSLRHLMYRVINFFYAFNEYDRCKVEPLDDPMYNLIIPHQVRLRQSGVWTVELFPPSQYKMLEHSLQKSGWKRDPLRSFDDTNAKHVRRAREGRGFSWSRIGSVAQANTNFVFPGTKREDLPEEFEYIQLTAVQLGTSVTAIVSFFQLSEAGESSLDRVFRGPHEPILTWQGFHRPKVTGRHFSAIEATQCERMRIHNLARTWLSRKCPGFFASRSNVHPVIDMNLFEGLDPVSEHDRADMRDALRALGMNTRGFHQYISSHMKGTVLIPTEGLVGPHEPLQNCWAIAGEYQRVVDENERLGYGNKPYASKTLGHMFDNAAGSFILHLAVMAYIKEQRSIYSASRDLASTRHRRFTARKARKLSAELLESGLDLSAVARDSRHLWSKYWHRSVDVQAVPTGLHRNNREPFDLIESLGEQRDAEFRRLLQEDETYRTVLSTAASLGASADAARTGRLALVVAVGSMIVATMTLLVTQPGDASLWSGFVEWLGLG